MQDFFTFDDLRLIRTIGEAGTLTGAARRLSVDHSTAFRRLGAIEKRVGARLFERARDGYTPTTAGDAAIAMAKRILDDLGELESRIAGEDLRPSGIVRVTTADTLLDLISPIIGALRTKHPEITIELVAANSFFTLTKRDADIAVRPAVVAPEGLVARQLAKVATAPYAAPAYLAQHGERELSQHEWIGFDDSLNHLGSAKWLTKHIASDRVVCRANSLMALRAAAHGGIGVTALPCYLGDADPLLQRVGPPLKEMEASLWLLTHPDLRRVARVRTVLDVLASHLAAERAFIEGRRVDAGPPAPRAIASPRARAPRR
jgi:DNA-binding transcriptional LysR family regulator